MNKGDIHSTLVKAKALISDEKNWSPKGWGVFDGEGKRCALNAIYSSAPTMQVAVQTEKFFKRNVLSGGAVGVYNDSHTHKKVMKKFDKAIKIAFEKEV